MGHPASTLTHTWIWQAIEALASRHGLSPSGLARLAELDPTAFNRSKRSTPEGRPRWPSTESIAKILSATGTSLDEFVELQCAAAAKQEVAMPDEQPDEAAGPGVVPVIGEIRDCEVTGLAVAEALLPASVRAGGRATGTRFALSVKDSSLEPVYSQGSTLYLSTVDRLSTGDRVVIKAAGAQPEPRVVLNESPGRVELATFCPERRRLSVQRQSIDWVARINWVRQ